MFWFVCDVSHWHFVLSDRGNGTCERYAYKTTSTDAYSSRYQSINILLHPNNHYEQRAMAAANATIIGPVSPPALWN